MSDVALVLGPVAFQDFEVPAQIGFGGEQRVAVHDLPGGARILDTLGPTPADISWNGIFSGPDATLRARLLDTLRVQAAVLTLSWDVFFYQVVIGTFTAEYRNTAWVPYTLRCSVLQDAAAVTPGADALLSDILGDAAAATGYAALGGLVLGALGGTLAVPGATTAATSAWLAATGALTAAQAQTQAGLDQANTGLASYGASGGLSAGDVGGLIAVAGQAAALATGNGFLGRAITNLADASI